MLLILRIRSLLHVNCLSWKSAYRFVNRLKFVLQFSLFLFEPVRLEWDRHVHQNIIKLFLCFYKFLKRWDPLLFWYHSHPFGYRLFGFEFGTLVCKLFSLFLVLCKIFGYLSEILVMRVLFFLDILILDILVHFTDIVLACMYDHFRID